MKKAAYLVKIYGRVTGVGFRFFVLDKSREYPSVTGYVRNVCRGEVEVLVQGDEDEVEAMIGCLRLGPPYADVESLEKIKVNFQPEIKDFQIR